MSPREILGDLVALLHAGFVVFVVGGFALIVVGWLLRWRWVQNKPFRFAHLAAVAFTLMLTQRQRAVSTTIPEPAQR
ncbi:MAG TPA: DUF2784 family protein [Tepidisphaeraceae bacterium]|jgi:hypothetical protein